MTLTIKNSPDLNSPGKPGASSLNSENKSSQSPRSNPVCLEVAITIRSLPSEAAGLREPIREEGRTVIVFDNGAVVRSTNNLPIGQTFILSNPAGRDVVCRVVGGRNLPSIKGYVEVEFLEPVNDFWHIHDDSVPAAVLPPVAAFAVRQAPKPPSPVAPRESAALETPAKPASVPSGSGPSFDDIPGLLSSPVSAHPRALNAEPPKPSPERSTKANSNYDLSEIANPTSVANWRSPVVDPPTEKLSSPAAMEDSPSSSSAPARSHDFLSKGLMAYEKLNTSSNPSSGRTPLIVGLSTLVLAFVGGVVFFVHRGAVNVSGAIPQVASQLSNSGQQPVNDAPSPAGLHKGETSQAPAQSRSSSQNPAQPVAPEQPQPLAAVASVPATATGPTTTDVRIESMPAQSNARRQEKSPVAAKQPEVPAARRPVIPSLKLGSPSAPKQILANSSEGAAPLTDISSADAGGGSSTDGLLTSAGRTSNPPAPPAAPAPTPIPVPKILRDPEVITTMRPVYPPTARQSNIQGTVTVSASIDENGNVVSSKAVSGPILLRQAAADAVKQWKYSPRLVDGKPAPSQVTVNVEFKLK